MYIVHYAYSLVKAFFKKNSLLSSRIQFESPRRLDMINTIPLEISLVDADDINRFFNEGPKLFKRPGMAIDREVYSL